MSTQQQSYYDVLDVERTASQTDIKRAFRKLAKKYHPDTNPGHSQASAKRLKQVMAAYRVLSNERERARYDVLLQTSPEFGDPAPFAKGNTVSERVREKLDDLLSGEGLRAPAAYDDVACQEGFRLDTHRDLRDHLDCFFLPAAQHRAWNRAME